MPGDVAIIDEIAGLHGAEYQNRAGATADDAWRGTRRRKHDVVLGTLAVQERDLHDLALGGRKQRVYLTVDRAANADIDHAAVGDSPNARCSARRGCN